MDYEIAYDVSRFVEASTEQVLHTLVEAFILVSLVVYLFLGDVRSTIIPALAMPVSLVGAFFVLQLMGFSINLITLFSMVLAIGIVVDNAIVVVEAVHAKMAETHLSPYRATIEVLKEISGAIIAITLVMSAVFVPVTFLPGPVGVFYRQFGVTMASTIVLSGVVALTLTPVLCAMVLQPHSHQPAGVEARKGLRERLRGLSVKTVLGYVFVGLPLLAGITYLAYELWGRFGLLMLLVPFIQKPFSLIVDKITDLYAFRLLRPIVTLRVVTMVVIGAFAYGIVATSNVLPTGFIPGEDQGMIYAVLQTPPGSTLEYTNAKAQELERMAKEVKGIRSVTSVAGYEVLTEGRGSNAGTAIINLDDWTERAQTSSEIIEHLKEKTSEMTNVKLEFFEPPAIPGFGAAGGIALRVLDQTQSSTPDYKLLGEINEQIHRRAAETERSRQCVHVLCVRLPTVRGGHQQRCGHAEGGVDSGCVGQPQHPHWQHLRAGLCSFRPVLQSLRSGLAAVPAVPSDLRRPLREERQGGDGPLLGVHEAEEAQGLNEITRYNLYPSAAIQLVPAAGYTTGQAIEAVQEVAAATLPRGYDIGWEGLSCDESKQGQRGGLHLPGCGGVRLPGAGRAVRELPASLWPWSSRCRSASSALSCSCMPWDWRTTFTLSSAWSCWSVCWARTRF